MSARRHHRHKKKPPPIERVLFPFREFARFESSGGILLIFATLIAMIWANSGASESYFHLWHTEISFRLGSFELAKSLHHWINDGLMVIFFFVVGLEIKREIIAGELSSAQRAALPIAGAVGGMVVPALVYVALNFGTGGMSGWGIPMATDIAFALGVLTLLGKRVPLPLKIFLTALAIVDDIGAVLVIAIFYTSELSIAALAYGGVFLFFLIIANAAGVRRPLVYVLLGFAVWLCFLKSGVHATVAGVLISFTIPARTILNTKEFLQESSFLIKKLETAFQNSKGSVLIDTTQQSALQGLEETLEEAETPLQRLEHTLLPWTTFFIMPIFALANAGVKIGAGEETPGLLESPVSLGIILGLFFGKQFGITIFSWIAVKLGFASLPKGVNWGMIYGAACLGGIGFTMSLFVANLAFPGAPELLDVGKMGILTASALSAAAGFPILKYYLNRRKP